MRSREGPEPVSGGAVTLASDQDREATVAVLCDAYAAGRLDLAELRDRAGTAYTARTWSDLRELTSDLPGWPAGSDRPEQPWRKTRHGPARPAGPPGRLFAPTWLMSLVWLAIAATAPVSVRAIPMVLMALLVVLAAFSSRIHHGQSTGGQSTSGPPGRCRQRDRNAVRR